MRMRWRSSPGDTTTEIIQSRRLWRTQRWGRGAWRAGPSYKGSLLFFIAPGIGHRTPLGGKLLLFGESWALSWRLPTFSTLPALCELPFQQSNLTRVARTFTRSIFCLTSQPMSGPLARHHFPEPLVVHSTIDWCGTALEGPLGPHNSAWWDNFWVVIFLKT